MFEITVEENFSAAHYLLKYNGDCENLHGHNWRVEITFKTSVLGENGLGIDFRIAKRILHHAIDSLDHSCLNHLDEFKTINPSCENISKFIYKKARQLHASESPENTTIDSVTVWESPGSKVTYRPE